MAKAALAPTRPLVPASHNGSYRWGAGGYALLPTATATPEAGFQRWHIRCHCVADNDNVNAARSTERMVLGIILAGPLLASLCMVALLVGFAQ